MGLSNIIVPGFVAVVLLSGCKTPSPAIKALKVQAPAAAWDESSIVKADVTCDGIEDTIVLGRQKNTAWIGVVPGSAEASAKTKPMASSFPIGKHSQDSFCTRPVQIKLYDHDCDGGEYGTLHHCNPKKGCKDFSVADNNCDSFNFFWDTDGELSWWRN